MPTQAPPPQDYPRFILIVILLFFLYTSPDQQPPPGFASPHDYAAERVSRAWSSLDILNATRWRDFEPKGPDTKGYDTSRYLNLTGFREGDEYNWERLGAFRKRSEEFTKEANSRRGIDGDDGKGMVGMVYENVTGVVNGRWVRYMGDVNGEPKRRNMNMTEISPGVDWAFRHEEDWTRNITGNEGKLRIRVDEVRGKEMMVPLGPASRGFEDTHTDLTFPLELVKEVGATVIIQDESSSGDGWEMKVHGVHWPRQGVMMMTTTSDKFAGIFGLPHLTPTADYFTTSQKLLNSTLEKVVKKMEKTLWVDPGNPWSATPDSQGDSTMPVPHCEFVIYVQLYPLSIDQGVGGGYLRPVNVVEIEEELRFPNGAPITQIPKLQMSTVIFSPDCGFMLESKGPPAFSPVEGEHLVGIKQEIFLHSIQNWLHIFGLVVFGQILLLKTQSKEASTPSTIGRVSLYTIAMMLMADSLLFASLSLLSAEAPNLFPSATLTSFAALMSVALGVRFIGAVYNVQEPERRERIRVQEHARAVAQSAALARAATLPSAAPIITAAGADIPTRPTVTIPTAPVDLPIIIPSDQDIDAEILENTTNGAAAAPLLPTTNPTAATTPTPPRASSSFGSLYIRFVLSLILILFLSVSATAWSIPFRSAYTHLMAFIYLSFWLPQIRRNIIRNCRKALLWKFVIGQSILRLLPFSYFYLKEDNILFAETDWKAFCVLAGWVWIQVWILAAQEVLGPRWGLPKNWTEQGWDYHPILREDNVEAGGLPIGLMQIPASPSLERSRTSEDLGSRKKKDGSNLRTVDCAICMQTLEVPVVPAGEDVSGSVGTGGGVTGMLARRQYMVTPCRHVFHTACLEGWMRFRLQCPIDREDLPPI